MNQLTTKLYAQKTITNKPVLVAGLFEAARGTSTFPMGVQLFTSAPNQINAQDKDGNTPLIIATSKGNQNGVKALINNTHTEINAKNNDWDTALHVALKKGFISISKDLVKAGSETLAANRKGKSPFTMALKRYQNDLSTENLMLLQTVFDHTKQPIGFTDISPKAQHELVDGFNILLKNPTLLNTPLEINIGPSKYKAYLNGNGEPALISIPQKKWEAIRLNKVALFSHNNHHFIAVSTVSSKTHYLNMKSGTVLSVGDSTGVKIIGDKAIIAEHDFVLDNRSQDIGKTRFYDLSNGEVIRDEKILSIIKLNYSRTQSLDLFGTKQRKQY
jgi:ankyrin repeat protein